YSFSLSKEIVHVTKVETISPPWDFVDTPCDYASYYGGYKTQNLIYERKSKLRSKLESQSIMKPIKKHAFAIMLSSCFYHIKKQLLNLAHTTYLLFGEDSVSLICIFPSLPSTRPFGTSLASGSIRTPNSRESNPMMGDPLGSSRVSSQKQNRKGVIGAQSG
ncbi:hypothetical protein DVH24_002367, partial [Malus domestica]